MAIVQARMGSTRLPGKVLLNLEGKTVLEHVVRRIEASEHVDDVVVATTISKADLRIVELCAHLGISIYCGSESDVLDRYYQAAKLFKANNILRITSDCPVIDARIIDEVISLHLKTNADYTSNTLRETYPDGQDIEVFTFASLKTAWNNAKLASEREHVTPYIRNNPEFFKYSSLESKEDLSQKRWTLDNAEDLDFLRLVYKYLYNKNQLFGMADILSLIIEKPEIEQINQHIIRNEGYLKSLKEDKTLNLDNIEE
ncbi:MAG: glycosyltransferase family protein [Methanosarcinales archaeon]|nr:glycosyltransferase family protein [Methanosarcinales archaeon]